MLYYLNFKELGSMFFLSLAKGYDVKITLFKNDQFPRQPKKIKNINRRMRSLVFHEPLLFQTYYPKRNWISFQYINIVSETSARSESKQYTTTLQRETRK